VSVSASLGKLKQNAKDLRVQWLEARQFWRDENSRCFEEQFLAPLFAQLRRAELAMGHMASILQKARRDCE